MRPAPRRPGNICTWSVMRAPGRVHEVDHRHVVAQRLLLDAQDLLDRLRPPRARLHGRVVRHQRDPAAADQRHAGHDAVGAEPVLVPVGEQRLLGERLRVHEPRHALADRDLALVGQPLAVLLRAARERALERLVEAALVGVRCVSRLLRQSPSCRRSIGTGSSPE